MAAHSGPKRLFGNTAMNATTVMDKNPKIGTDCKISMNGMIMRSARLLFAAQVAKVKVNNNEKNKAINMRDTVRKAYPGKWLGSKEIGMDCPSS
jgi:hypothetical protein